jgi:membrane protease YdiL (CAAX protease family)
MHKNQQKPISSQVHNFLFANSSEIVILGATALVFSLGKYHVVLNAWFNSLLYFAIVPLLVILFLLRRNPLDFGLRWGNFRKWGPQVGAACLILTPILLAASNLPDFQKYYRVEDFQFWKYFLTQCALLAGWEYVFRGFLLFGLKEKFKETSIVVQMLPFVLLHIGKPELETISTVFTGLYFGWLCYRGQSYWPAFIIHVFINVFFVSIINLK